MHECRKEFEAWCYGRHSIKRNERGFYDHDTTDFAWLAWKEAWDHPNKQSAVISNITATSGVKLCLKCNTAFDGDHDCPTLNTDKEQL